MRVRPQLVEWYDQVALCFQKLLLSSPIAAFDLMITGSSFSGSGHILYAPYVQSFDAGPAGVVLSVF
jgi:hypothetical protein